MTRPEGTRKYVKRQLLDRDFQLPLRPTYELPKLPLNLTDKIDDELMRIFIKLTRYQDHIAGELVSAEIDEHDYESQLEIAKARVVVANWTGASESRVAVAKAEAILDPGVRKIDDLLIEAKARRKILGVLADSVQRDAGVVSREISRRIGREGNDRRIDRYNP